MRKIDLPKNDTAIDELKEALTYKNGTSKHLLTSDEISIIESLYKKYDLLKGVADDDFKSIKLNSVTNNAIHVAYDEVQEKNRLKDLRAKILLAVNRCPYCGISVADELDHHLPCSIYKALSVYSSNLIPICHKCNNKKRTITGVNVKERFSHFYFDHFPSSPIFLAEVVFINNSLKIDFKIDDSNISPLLFEQLSFQIEKINLRKRLDKECNIYLSSFGIALNSIYGESNVAAVKDFLNSQAKENERIFGINDWRTALITSLTNCEDFCNGGFKHYFNILI